MTKKELERLDILIGFVNDICEIVCDPDKYLDPNTKDSPTLSIGYFEGDKNESLISAIDGDDINYLKDTLTDLKNQIKGYSKVDFSKQWEELRS